MQGGSSALSIHSLSRSGGLRGEGKRRSIWATMGSAQSRVSHAIATEAGSATISATAASDGLGGEADRSAGGGIGTILSRYSSLQANEPPGGAGPGRGVARLQSRPVWEEWRKAAAGSTDET